MKRFQHLRMPPGMIFPLLSILFLNWLSLTLFPSIALAQCDLRLANAYLGKEFWVQHIDVQDNLIQGNWGLAIVAPYGAVVHIDLPAAGWQLPPLALEPGTAKVLNAPEELIATYEAENPEHRGRIDYTALRIRANNPIAVFVCRFVWDYSHSKKYAHTSYVAYPVESWGQRYLYAGYYPARQADLVTGAPNGFFVIAKENGTHVSVLLRGQGQGVLRLNGQSIPIQFPQDWEKTFSFQLNEGEVLDFTCLGFSAASNKIDITGSEILSSKPVGVIAYNTKSWMVYMHSSEPYPQHPEAVVPRTEMIPPKNVWGRAYITRAVRNERVQWYGNSSYVGDNYRVVAVEDNTVFTVRWYDPNTHQFKGEWSALLRRTGDYIDYVSGGDLSEFIEGFAVWQSDKPVMVGQYGGVGAKTLMWAVPLEQYLCEHFGYAWEYKGGELPRWTLIVQADSNEQVLQNIWYNGQKLLDYYPPALWEQVPNTGYWAIQPPEVPRGIQHLKGPVPMALHIFNVVTEVLFASSKQQNIATYATDLANYGHTLMGWDRLDKFDTVAPRLQKEEACGTVHVVARDDSVAPPYEDGGISRVELLTDRSYNYRLVMEYPENFDNQGEGYWRRVEFRLEVLDMSKDAKAVYGITDWQGNVRLDSTFYKAPKFWVSDSLLSFDTVRVGKSRTLLLAVVNESDSVVLVEEVKLKIADEFEIVSITPDIPASLAADDTMWVELRYTPRDERSDPEDWDIDSLFATTPCVEFPLAELRGQGVLPHIVVGDWDAGQVPVGLTRCNSENIQDFQRTVEIRNPGSTVLTITEIRNVTAPFSLDQSTYTLPIKVQPGETIYFKGACFTPPAVQKYQIDVEFVCDAPAGDDNISRWKGEGIQGAPYITSYDWKWQRLQTVHSGQVEVGNGGNNAVTVRSVSLTAATPHFRITGYEFEGTPLTDPDGVTLNPGQRLLVFVEYEPQVETAVGDTLKVGIRAEFVDAEAVEGELRGQAYLPKIGAEGYEFECVELGTESAEQGVVKIWNADAVWQLQIWNVEFDTGVMSDPQAFWAENWPQFPVTLDVGDTLKLAVRFRARTYPQDSVRVRIVSDAAAGPEEEPQVESGVMVRGCAYVVGLEAEGTVIGPVLGCDGGEGTIVVRNTGSAAVDVTDVRIAGGDVGEFEVIGPRQFVVPAGGEQQVGVRLLPGEAGQYEVEVLVESGSGDTTVVVRGERYSVPVVFAVESVEEAKLPGDTVAISLSYTDSSGEAMLDTIVLSLRYDARALGYLSIARLQPGWTMTVTPTGIGELLMQARGAVPLANGIFATLRFVVYAETQSDSLTLDLAVQNIGNRALCVEPQTQPGTIPLAEFCLRKLRNIVLGTTYGLQVQVDKTQLVIRYGVGLDGPVHLQVFNSVGRQVWNFQQRTAAGWWEQAISTRFLGTGLYLVHFRSGRYSQTVPVWIE